MKKLFKGKVLGFFFGKRKEEKTDSQKAEEMLQLYLKYIPQLRSIMSGGNDEIGVGRSDGDILGRMYDFYVDYGGTVPMHMNAHGFDTMVPNPDFHIGNGQPPLIALTGNSADQRIAKKPVEVVAELEDIPVPFTVEGLDDKIAMFKDKALLLNQRYAKDQILGFCKRLENRKHYRDNVEFYSSFPNTSDDKIDDLLKKYKLVMKSSDLFVPTFPKEAIDVMKKYTEVTKRVTGEAPVFYVIAEEIDFKEKVKKLDPILLVQSPFGFYWQVLGAWDKEMLLLSEL